jgi:radical SAM protein with 4Fe4S-binding SPASM domain
MKLTNISRKLRKLRTITPRQAVNSLLNEIEIRTQVPRMISMPQIADIVLTKRCNLACRFCKDYKNTDIRDISLDNFSRLARQVLPFVRRLQICSGGEPYLHRDLIPILRVAKSYSPETVLLSNGMLLDRERIETIVGEELLSQHGFSVDGITAGTVESIRRNARLDKILENINAFIAACSRHKGKRPAAFVRYVLMKSNLAELPRAVEYWGKAGLDRLDCIYLHLGNDIDRDEVVYYHQESLREAFRQARATASRYPRLTLSLPPLPSDARQTSARPVRCRMPWELAYVNADGTLYQCYKMHGLWSPGNVFEGNGNTFRRIWNGEDYRRLRDTVNNDRRPKKFAFCAKCPMRLGWTDELSHLGDEVLLESLQLSDTDKEEFLKHRKRGAAVVRT